MAIQNFLSGGYYGKLGATVGQRWKNKRTVRAYVVPRNPRTPKQQANRGQFGSAVTFAQAGLQMNYYATCFENESFTRWNYRMKTARFLERESFEYLDLIPLYPPNFTPPQLITSIKILGTEGANKIIFSCPGLTFEEKRTFSMMFAFFTADGVFEGYKLYIGYYDPAIPEQIECTVDNIAEVNEFSRVRLVTNDDKDSATDMIASRMLVVEGADIDIKEFDTTIQSVSSTLTETKITFYEPFRVSNKTEISGVITGISQGGIATLNVNKAALVEDDGFFAVRITTSYASDKERIAFPTGSQMEITEVLAEGDTFVYSATDVTEPLISTDLTRILDTAAFNVSAITSTLTQIQAVFDLSTMSGVQLPGNPSVGTVTTSITASVTGISEGASETKNVSAVAMVASGGKYAVNFPASYTSDKQRIAFPSGSQLSITAVSIVANGVTYTAASLTKAVQSTDLTRTLSTSDWSNGGGSTMQEIRLALYGTNGKNIASCSYSCGGRMGKTTPETVTIAFLSQSATYATYEVLGAFSAYPCPSGSQIVIPATTFNVQGVTYNAPQTTLAVTNSITVSPFLTDNAPQKYRDGLESAGDYLYSINMTWNFDFTASSTAVTTPSGLQCYVEDSVTQEGAYSDSVQGTLDNISGECELTITFSYDDAAADWTPSRCVVTITPQNANITVGGVAYRLPNIVNDALSNWAN